MLSHPTPPPLPTYQQKESNIHTHILYTRRRAMQQVSRQNSALKCVTVALPVTRTVQHHRLSPHECSVHYVPTSDSVGLYEVPFKGCVVYYGKLPTLCGSDQLTSDRIRPAAFVHRPPGKINTLFGIIHRISNNSNTGFCYDRRAKVCHASSPWFCLARCIQSPAYSVVWFVLLCTLLLCCCALCCVLSNAAYKTITA